MRKMLGLLLLLWSVGVMAEPCGAPPRRQHGMPGCDRGRMDCRYDHGRGSDGVRLAADIVGLVGASLDILRTPAVYTAPVYSSPATVVVPQPAAPVVVTSPYIQVQPVYVAPQPIRYAPYPVHYRCPPPRPGRYW